MLAAAVLDGRHFLTLWVVVGVILIAWNMRGGRCR